MKKRCTKRKDKINVKGREVGSGLEKRKEKVKVFLTDLKEVTIRMGRVT